MRRIPYEKPVEGRDYKVWDNFLPDPDRLFQAAMTRTDWIEGAPYRPERWPGRRCRPALEAEQLLLVERALYDWSGSKRLYQPEVAAGQLLDHNVFQLVGGAESGPRPHTDSRKLAHYAGVLYLSPEAPPTAGTSFYRLRNPDGSWNGNRCPPAYATLPEALGLTQLPLEAWQEDVRIENRFNRLLLYRADLVHSASAYFGRKMEKRRLTALFFFLSDPPAL